MAPPPDTLGSERAEEVVEGPTNEGNEEEEVSGAVKAPSAAALRMREYRKKKKAEQTVGASVKKKSTNAHAVRWREQERYKKRRAKSQEEVDKSDNDQQTEEDAEGRDDGNQQATVSPDTPKATRRGTQKRTKPPTPTSPARTPGSGDRGANSSAQRNREWRTRQAHNTVTPRVVRKRGRPSTPRSPPSAPRVRKHRRSKASNTIFPKWAVRHNCGKLSKRCGFCIALHFEKERPKCCSGGKVILEEPQPPQYYLAELLDSQTEVGRRHRQKLVRVNTLFSFAARQCTLEKISGQGVPTTKIRGPIAHTCSNVLRREGATSQFGALYTLDLREASQCRQENIRVAEGIDSQVIMDLGEEFQQFNELAHQFRFMCDVLEKEERGGNLQSVYMRLVPKSEMMKNATAAKLIEKDHPGTFNIPDQTMVALLYKTDDAGSALLPKGFNVYAHHKGGPGYTMPFFSELVNPMCYPLIHPYGHVDFKNGTIYLIKPMPLSEIEFKKRTEGDMSDSEGEEEPDEMHPDGANNGDATDGDVEDNETDGEVELEDDPEAGHMENEDEDGEEGQEEDEIWEDELPTGQRVLVEFPDDQPEDPPTEDDAEDMPLLPRPQDIRNETPVVQPGDLSESSDEEERPVEEVVSDLPSEGDDSDEGEARTGADDGQGNNENVEGAVETNDPDDAAGALAEDEEDAPVVDGDDPLEDHGSSKRRFVSHLQWLRYRLARRTKSKWKYHNIFSTGRVAQHYIMDNYLRIVNQRMYHVQQNNTETMGTKRNAFYKAMQKSADQRGRRLGMAITVPSKIVGSPAYLRKMYEDTMAMISKHGRPDLFITFTGNRKWPEIERCRRPTDTWADIADIAVRVFNEKFERFKELVIKEGVFGKVKAFAYSIELQQRGMPHAHVLITLEDGYKLDTPEKVDQYIWARIPDPDSETDPERKKELEELRELVLKHMIHTPCSDNPDAYCRQNPKRGAGCPICDKGFPKPFRKRTVFLPDGYVQPARPKDVSFPKVVDFKTKKAVDVTSQWVVSYNPWLLRTFDSHINMECCSTVKACKYIFKYIFKGFDKALIEFVENCRVSNGTRSGAGTIGGVTVGGHLILPKAAAIPRSTRAEMERDAVKRLRNHNIDPYDANNKPTLVYDETRILQSMRSLTAPEALLGVYQIPTARLSHTVTQLAVHEEGEEHIYWQKGHEEQRLQSLNKPGAATSQLTAWFALNRRGAAAANAPDGSQEAKYAIAPTLTYNEVPFHFRWNSSNKTWTVRGKSRKVVPRVYTVSPKFAERFAIRLLALNQRGPQFFEDLRTLEDGTVCTTFQEAARELGLLNDEKEWEHAMEEASTKDMPVVLRRLFATIVAFCPVKDKQALFDKFAEEMYDRSQASTETKRARALFHIESILKNCHINNKIAGLEEPDQAELRWDQGTRAEGHNENLGIVISEAEAEKKANEMYAVMNSEQKHAFDRVVKAADDCNTGERCFFLDGPGGTGKTYVYRAVYYALIAAGHKVLMVAHTGIAATLLINGTTVHRQFCIPLNADEGARSTVEDGSSLENKIAEAEAVIWDEATMSDRRVLACVDKLLRDLSPCHSHLPFGGKCMLLGGDWKQLLPVVKKTYGREIIDYTIKRGNLWPSFTVLKLKKNMRVEVGCEEFAKFLDEIGRGATPNADPDGDSMVRLPNEMALPSEDDVIEWAYGGGQLSVDSCDAIKDTCILSVLNESTLEINHKVLDMLPGEERIVHSVDTCAEPNNNLELPAEMYHKQTPSGMPPHELRLKKGCLLVLMRNINVPRGQCNGTRMQLVEVTDHLLICKNLSEGPFHNDTIMLPRVELTPQDRSDPSLNFNRLQFPVRLAYAMTVNKAQGQTLKKVGLVLRTPVFSHGQLYVALSRARTRDGVKIFAYNYADFGHLAVNNIVYKEILT